MHSPVDTKNSAAVQAEVRRIFTSMFPGSSEEFIPCFFGWADECFNGRQEGYQAIDALYHDMEHTLQGTLCLMRLLKGRHFAGVEPRLTPKAFELSLAAILLHDSGYLKTCDDVEGTGAKYTVTHVTRSAEFAEQLLAQKGFDAHDILTVQNMIRCTGVNASIASIPFQDDLERICGLALVTADLLGQMAAEDYVEKLPVLFSEFDEASHFSNDPSHFVASFKSASDLLERTPIFWHKFVRPKMDGELGGLYRFLSDPYPSGPNYYLESVEANLRRIASTG